MPSFENHFLALYRDYLLGEIATAPREGKLVAIQRLAEVLYPGSRVAGMLKQRRESPDNAIRQAATLALDAIEHGRH